MVTEYSQFLKGNYCPKFLKIMYQLTLFIGGMLPRDLLSLLFFLACVCDHWREEEEKR